jgi:hypothetical protein
MAVCQHASFTHGMRVALKHAHMLCRLRFPAVLDCNGTTASHFGAAVFLCPGGTAAPTDVTGERSVAPNPQTSRTAQPASPVLATYPPLTFLPHTPLPQARGIGVCGSYIPAAPLPCLFAPQPLCLCRADASCLAPSLRGRAARRLAQRQFQLRGSVVAAQV